MPDPRFPIYVLSKGRADSAPTPRALDRMGVPYRIVIEEQEHDTYARHFPEDRLLHLDPAYRDAYDPCMELPDGASYGSGPARNFAWEHSIAEGWDWHWVVDDNITGWFRMHKNQKVPCADGTPFAAMETFATRYRNVAIAGPHYYMFAPARNKHPPFQTGTRVYSCLLIRNSVPLRWEARYNEDVDLCLRVLKEGWATILFFAFLQGKLTTQVMTGGNTDAFYSAEGTLPKTEMLVRRHPDVAKLTQKWGRWHHHVDYSRWRHQPLVPDPDWVDPQHDWSLRRRDAAYSHWVPGSFFGPDQVRKYEERQAELRAAGE